MEKESRKWMQVGNCSSPRQRKLFWYTAMTLLTALTKRPEILTPWFTVEKNTCTVRWSIAMLRGTPLDNDMYLCGREPGGTYNFKTMGFDRIRP